MKSRRDAEKLKEYNKSKKRQEIQNNFLKSNVSFFSVAEEREMKRNKAYQSRAKELNNILKVRMKRNI